MRILEHISQPRNPTPTLPSGRVRQAWAKPLPSLCSMRRASEWHVSPSPFGVMTCVLVFILLVGTSGGCGSSQSTRSPSDPSQAKDESEAVSETTRTDETASESQAPENGSQNNEFRLQDSDTAGDAHGVSPSKIEPTETHAALKFFVVDKEEGPVEGIVISLTGPEGDKYYTRETDAQGYAEVLVPVGQKYDLVYLSLGREDVTASVPVSDEPNQNIKLTLRYQNLIPEKEPREPRFVLGGITFDTGKATIRPESFKRLDRVVEYMTHKKSARIEIAGHTDNVGDPKANKALSLRRAEACRDYLISKGIDGDRIEAVGYGAERPIDDNSTVRGRQRNRRIEAKEL